ncbi:MAG: anthranilate synthase component I family protein [Phycisphaerae bacterium]|nr:anthranilate synthase component I family protein [Phycisphaerae bacterium]
MGPEHDREPVRWCSRTIRPPADIAALRQAVATRPHGVMLESVDIDGSWGRYSIFGIEPVRTMTVAWEPGIDPFFQLSRACRPWCRLEPERDLPFVAGWVGYLAYEAGHFIEPSVREPARHQVCPPACSRTDRIGGKSPLGASPVSYWALFDTVLVHDGLAERWYVAGAALPPRLAGRQRPPVSVRLDAFERFVAGGPSAVSDRRSAGATRGDKPTHAARMAPANATSRTLPRAARTSARTSEDRIPVPRLTASTPTASTVTAGTGQWSFSRDAYLAKVERALEYIRAGDVFQVNLARRCCFEMEGRPIDLYQRLCAANPAAYAAYLQIPGPEGPAPLESSNPGILESSVAILSSSPELFLHLRGGAVTTRPIKGTRPRGETPALDAAARLALRESEKDRAELNMIIDLERNDLGRVCEFGTVRVVHDGEIETFPTVHHRTATVTGRLRGDADAIDLLRATFPGGSITGAPKVRAMQIINELEPDPRGPYCGTIGYIGLDGDMQLNLAIRTMTVLKEDSRIRGFEDSRDAAREATVSLEPSVPGSPGRYCVRLHVGSGIVADSDPEDEYEELRAKAAGMLAALSENTRPRSTSRDVADPNEGRPGRPCGVHASNTPAQRAPDLGRGAATQPVVINGPPRTEPAEVVRPA